MNPSLWGVDFTNYTPGKKSHPDFWVPTLMCWCKGDVTWIYASLRVQGIMNRAQGSGICDLGSLSWVPTNLSLGGNSDSRGYNEWHGHLVWAKDSGSCLLREDPMSCGPCIGDSDQHSESGRWKFFFQMGCLLCFHHSSFSPNRRC